MDLIKRLATGKTEHPSEAKFVATAILTGAGRGLILAEMNTTQWQRFPIWDKAGFSVLSALTILLVSAWAVSGAALGMKAPPLQVGQWVKGDAVDLAAGAGKKIFVVEFWATWCPPCRESIPHLTALQKKFKEKGVVIAGISDETIGDVKPFVQQMGAKMNYSVGVDRNQGTAMAYMAAFGVNTIPHAFLVDKTGAIVWTGNPLSQSQNGTLELETLIERLLDGKGPTFSKAAAPKPAPAVASVPAVVPDRLVVTGILGGAGGKGIAIINGHSLNTGEEEKVNLGNKSVLVKCLEIQRTAVVVSVDGAAKQTLQLENR